MIRREDALKQLALLQDDNHLPASLQENKMRADYLLFKEAQVNYMQRRRQMMKQIIFDNVHYCTLKQIMDQAVE